MHSLHLAKEIAKTASELKATQIKVLDLRNLSSFTDFFVICSGNSDRQNRAIADRIIEQLKSQNLRPISVEGYDQGRWILVDYADVVLHVFDEESRHYYDLEGFWEKASSLKVVLKRKKKKQRETPTARRRKGKRSSLQRKN